MKKYEESLSEFIYNKKREYTDRYFKLRDQYFVMLKLKSNAEPDHMKYFSIACKCLNDINKNFPTWDDNYNDTKETFVSKCRERRLELIKLKNEILKSIETIENKYNTY